MPLYDYKCGICPSAERYAMRKIADRYIGPKCYRCGLNMHLIVSPVAGIVKNPAVPKRPKQRTI